MPPACVQGNNKRWWNHTKLALRLQGNIAKIVFFTLILTISTVLQRQRTMAVLDEAMIRSGFGKEQQPAHQHQAENPNTTSTKITTTTLQRQGTISSSFRTETISNSGIRSTLPRDVLASVFVPPKRRSRIPVQGAGSLTTPWSEDANPNTTKFVLNPKCNDPETQSLFQKQPEHTAGNKILTFFLMYYNDVDHTAHQLASWRNFSVETKEKVQFVIVDDGSAEGFRAIDVLQAQSDWKDHDIDIVVYEIEQDLVWNIGGVRNLGFFVAATDWVFLSDADFITEPVTMDYILQKVELDYHCKNCIYRKFHRLRADGETFKPHPAAMVLTKSAYWTAGGCDEDFVGNYGQTDIHFFQRAHKVESLKIELLWKEMEAGVAPALRELPDGLPCPPELTCIPAFDKSTQERPSRDTSINKILLKKKSRGRVPWSNEYLRFRWRRVW